jgi:hypothetical protein
MFTNANILQAFNITAVGTRVVQPDLFMSHLSDAVEVFDFDSQTTPGQGFISLPDEAFSSVSAGVGKQRNDTNAYVLRSWRGSVGPYLKRDYAAEVEGLAAIVYTTKAYLTDPDVARDSDEVSRVEATGASHVIVAVLAFAGPKAPLSPSRLVSNLAGGNRSALVWDADEIRKQAKESAAYAAEWSVVAD